MNLYEINADMQRLIDCAIDPETGEIVDENLFKEVESLNIEKESKIEYWGLVIKNNKADADILKAHAKRIKEEAEAVLKKAEAIENNNDRIKEYLIDNLGGEKFKTKLISMYYHPSDKVITDDEKINLEEMPSQFVRIKKELDKDQVKNALLSGAKVEGCTLEHNVSLVVR